MHWRPNSEQDPNKTNTEDNGIGTGEIYSSEVRRAETGAPFKELEI